MGILSNLGWKLGFAITMASMMATIPFIKIFQIENEWLQNFSEISLAMMGATTITALMFWLRNRNKK